MTSLQLGLVCWVAVATMLLLVMLLVSLRSAMPSILRPNDVLRYQEALANSLSGAAPLGGGDLQGDKSASVVVHLTGTVRSVEPVFDLTVEQRYQAGPRFVPTLHFGVWREATRTMVRGQSFVLDVGEGQVTVSLNEHAQLVPAFRIVEVTGKTRRVRGTIAEGDKITVYGNLAVEPDNGSAPSAEASYRALASELRGRIFGDENTTLVVADASIGLAQRAFWSGPNGTAKAPFMDDDDTAFWASFTPMALVQLVVHGVPSALLMWLAFRQDQAPPLAVAGLLLLDLAAVIFMCLRPFTYNVQPLALQLADATRRPLAADSKYRTLMGRVPLRRLDCVARWMSAQTLPLHSPAIDDREMQTRAVPSGSPEGSSVGPNATAAPDVAAHDSAHHPQV